MSRSTRKQPYITEQQYSKQASTAKRKANKAVRSNEEPSNGSWFKKVYNSYNICDFKFWSPDHKKGKYK